MAVNFTTQDPQTLLNAFDAAISQTDPKGKITTWRKHQGHYTHTSTNWADKAFFKPSVVNGALVFNIINPQGAAVSVTTYGYYHGHLIETFLNHFDKSFSMAGATPLPTKGDRLK